jgi:hypothetical protein
VKRIESLRKRWVVWVWNHTPNCAEMSRLASRSFERAPSFALRLKMRLHHVICAWCRRYERQLRFLHRAAPRLPEHLEAAANRTLSDEARARMKRRLRAARDA